MVILIVNNIQLTGSFETTWWLGSKFDNDLVAQGGFISTFQFPKIQSYTLILTIICSCNITVLIVMLSAKAKERTL